MSAIGARHITAHVGEKEQECAGRLKLINNPKGLFAVETEEGQYSIVELLGEYSPEVDDILFRKFRRHGRGNLKERNAEARLECFYSRHSCVKRDGNKIYFVRLERQEKSMDDYYVYAYIDPRNFRRGIRKRQG